MSRKPQSYDKWFLTCPDSKRGGAYKYFAWTLEESSYNMNNCADDMKAIAAKLEKMNQKLKKVGGDVSGLKNVGILVILAVFVLLVAVVMY